MNICGIDQSFTNTAVIVFDLNTGEIVNLKLFKSSKRSGERELTQEERIFSLNSAIQEYVISQQCEVVFLEGLSLNSNSRTMRDLAGLYYVLKAGFFGLNIPCFHIPPTSVKAFALKGNASKEEMFDEIPPYDKELIINTGAKKTTGLYDFSDAYWIGKFGIKKINEDNILV